MQIGLAWFVSFPLRAWKGARLLGTTLVSTESFFSVQTSLFFNPSFRNVADDNQSSSGKRLDMASYISKKGHSHTAGHLIGILFRQNDSLASSLIYSPVQQIMDRVAALTLYCLRFKRQIPNNVQCMFC